jgi:glycosyltransferase involved in cell wall biosynthesis
MRPKLLFVITEDRFFWSHRQPVARAALQAGYEVVVAARVHSCAERIRDAGFRFIPLELMRESYSPLKELRAIRQLRRIYRAEKPDLVHHVALKPVLYGSIAALGRKDTKVVNALIGLGYLVSSSSLKAKVLRFGIWSGLRFLLNRPRSQVLLQNDDDRRLLVDQVKVAREKTAVIRGSGVDVKMFQPTPEPAGDPIVLLVARMLWIKGVGDFVEAAALLKGRGLRARFALAGDTDFRSPSGVPSQQLEQWQNSGTVEWWGHQDEMHSVLQRVNIVCLPSHGGEGVPKALLEAAAGGRAIVTTDVPGCRDIVRQGVNGIVVPPHNPAALADAIETLLKNPALRVEMAKRGREIAVSEFSEEVVTAQTLSLYGTLLGTRAPRLKATVT